MPLPSILRQVVSGGQTGVDRAALDAAAAIRLPIGGWCPRGRKAEDGPIDLQYPLQETRSAAYPVRTRWNVRDSDGTLILHCGPLTRGTHLTREIAEELGKPHLCVDIDMQDEEAVEQILAWIRDHRIEVLNVAGPRESSLPGVYDRASHLMRKLLTA
ncbi:MAG: putative molybdenum carrier protein [Planctomycetales bacterium]|nr:putative molybdenum carrier protein [Planctomycetales bacterium]